MSREPIPPVTSRGDALGRLQRERWIAQDAGETALVADLDRRIQQLSASGTPTAPARETAASTQPRATAARTNQKPGPKQRPKPTKGNHRVSAR